MFCTNKKTFPSPCRFKETKTLNNLSAVPLFFILYGCTSDAITSILCHGSSRLPLLQKVHGSRSAVSSAKDSQRLAPTDVSLKANHFTYYSASLRYQWLYYITFFTFVKSFLEYCVHFRNILFIRNTLAGFYEKIDQFLAIYRVYYRFDTWDDISLSL